MKSRRRTSSYRERLCDNDKALRMGTIALIKHGIKDRRSTMRTVKEKKKRNVFPRRYNDFNGRPGAGK
jgi:hypothetical protein